MGGREILTLQFGHYSNYVGTHWWNLQEKGFVYNASEVSEINHDVLYREGVTNQKVPTFTPRLLVVDLAGSLKTLPEKGDLYEPVADTSKIKVEWEENLMEIKKKPEENKNEFQKDLENLTQSGKPCKSFDLDRDVSVWSDFLYSRFHPRTVNVIKEFQHNNETTPFGVFPVGTALWKKSEFSEDLQDKIRNYIEECDSFQGFHMLSDCSNAFSGFSSSCLEHLRDEYDRKSILVFPVIPSYFPDNDFTSDDEKDQMLINDSVRVLNTALSFQEYSNYSSLFVPLCTGSKGWRQPGPKLDFYHTEYNHKLPYHSSAILASALETVTLKHRLKVGNFSLADLCADLSYNGRKASAASLCFPFSFNNDADLLDCLDRWEGPLTKSITPNCTIGTESLMQHITLRGISEEKLKKPPNLAKSQSDLPAYKCNSINEMLSMYLSYSTHATASNVTVVHKPLNVTTPFPKIFDKSIGPNGFVCAKPRNEDIDVENVPVLAGLHSGSSIGNMLESLHTEARRIKIGKFPQFINEGVDKDDFETCLDNLFTLRENYEDNYYI